MSIIIYSENLSETEKILIDTNIKYKVGDALTIGLEEEANYRLDCFLKNYEEASAKYEKLTTNEQFEILKSIKNKYTECSSQIFDYDYMDDIVRNEILNKLLKSELKIDESKFSLKEI